jgi:hypothetical protein
LNSAHPRLWLKSTDQVCGEISLSVPGPTTMRAGPSGVFGDVGQAEAHPAMRQAWRLPARSRLKARDGGGRPEVAEQRRCDQYA